MNAGTSAPPIGTAVELPLGERPRDVAVARLLAVPPRDLLIDERLPPALHCVADARLVDVSIDGRRVLPGAWVEPRVLTQGRPVAGPAVTASDLRLPAVVLGEGRHAVLAWGGRRSGPFPSTTRSPSPSPAARTRIHRRCCDA